VRAFAAYDHQIAERLKSAPAVARRAEIARSLPGFGPILAATYAVKATELGGIDRRAAAALIGIAPLACDSGLMRGKRHCWGGRKHLRNLLRMATMQARKHGPFKALYQRLIEKGKAKKIALTAVGRKLVTVLNALLKANSLYDRNMLDRNQHSCWTARSSGPGSISLAAFAERLINPGAHGRGDAESMTDADQSALVERLS
jgi:transposase